MFHHQSMWTTSVEMAIFLSSHISCQLSTLHVAVFELLQTQRCRLDREEGDAFRPLWSATTHDHNAWHWLGCILRQRYLDSGCLPRLSCTSLIVVVLIAIERKLATQWPGLRLSVRQDLQREINSIRYKMTRWKGFTKLTKVSASGDRGLSSQSRPLSFVDGSWLRQGDRWSECWWMNKIRS